MDIVEQVRQNLKDALRYIRDRVVGDIELGMILGSGLGHVVDAVESPKVFSYDDIPHFPHSTVEGHTGNLVIGKLGDKRVAVMQGRFHYYEGYTSAGIATPIRVLHGLGAKALVVTCAAGGMRSDFSAGDVMAITDHVNMLGTNPLVGPNDPEMGPRFVDMSEAYDREFLETARAAAKDLKIDLREGVYVSVLGPSYETPAELRFLSTIADAVGMSTVPEVIVARHLGMRVLGLALITNIPNAKHKTSHDEVLATAQKSSEKFSRLVVNIVQNIKL